MSRYSTSCALAICTACWVNLCVAADDAATRKDLAAVIALQGLPCGDVVSVKTQGENDHVATCKNGIRYHIFLSSTGRVVVEKQ